MVSGGFRPDAPQNQTGVSSNGGNGSKDGQPTRLAAGGEWGSRTAMATQQSGAPMQAGSGPAPMPPMPMPTPITAYSQNPNQPITDGAPVGGGSNTLNLPRQRDNNAFNESIDSYAPVLSFIASRESTSTETRDAISLLLRGNRT